MPGSAVLQVHFESVAPTVVTRKTADGFEVVVTYRYRLAPASRKKPPKVRRQRST